MRRFIILSIALLNLMACENLLGPAKKAAVEVTAVSFDWSNTVWENVKFTVKNTGDYDLDSIDVYYTATCAGGNFDHIASFPSLFDMNSPVKPGNICYASTVLATLTGSASKLTINQITVGYDFKTETFASSQVFLRP